MDTNQQTPVTDDQELANVLAGMNEQAQKAPAAHAADNDTTETSETDSETPTLSYEAAPEATASETPVGDELPPVEAPTLEAPLLTPAEPVLGTPPVEAPTLATIEATASPELDGIKKDALEELRPLVNKLDLPADEKFDTLLLIIRSTDDKSLVNAAFDAAKSITDETRRAQALLDVIKEIDYFNGHGEQPAAA